MNNLSMKAIGIIGRGGSLNRETKVTSLKLEEVMVSLTKADFVRHDNSRYSLTDKGKRKIKKIAKKAKEVKMSKEKNKKIVEDALEKEGKDLVICVCFWTSGANGQDEGHWHDEIGMYMRHDDNGIWIDRMDTTRELQLIWDVVKGVRIVPKKESVFIINQLMGFIRIECDGLRNKAESFDGVLFGALK